MGESEIKCFLSLQEEVKVILALLPDWTRKRDKIRELNTTHFGLEPYCNGPSITHSLQACVLLLQSLMMFCFRGKGGSGGQLS